jgi:hypothetical protein
MVSGQDRKVIPFRVRRIARVTKSRSEQAAKPTRFEVEKECEKRKRCGGADASASPGIVWKWQRDVLQEPERWKFRVDGQPETTP